MAAVPELLQQQEEDRSKVRPSSPSCSRTAGHADLLEPLIPSLTPWGLLVQPCFSAKATPHRHAEAPAGPRVPFAPFSLRAADPRREPASPDRSLLAHARVSGTEGAWRVFGAPLWRHEKVLSRKKLGKLLGL